MSKGKSLSENLITLEQLEALPDLVWLVEGMLPKPSLAFLYGEPGGGKTFTALDLALSVASCSEWLGRKVESGNVLYIAAEGVLGLKDRVRAFRTKANIDGSRFRLLSVGFDIRDSEVRGQLLSALEEIGFRPDLIVVDTLARVTTGADENSAKDMGVAVDGLDALKNAFSASVLALHHTVKTGGAERGSSALRGAADVMIKCTPSENLEGSTVKIECTKMKDTEPFKPQIIDLKKVQFEDGGGSLILGGWSEKMSIVGSQGADTLLDILKSDFAENGATNKELKEAFLAKTGSSDATFSRALREMKKNEIVHHNGKGKGTLYSLVGVTVK